ncbi:HlyD family type I secretion periplasmic adaptor subunit [Roseomonas genomospecies 6]|uniref:Membrane fusion protein (MFP) family protein n=1 Tax=Roseomonas genomospecies 6 TaxID=214106 RepID=A0A9W7NH31_9PROT|nr:HlyD family type I secretion periplasmic adaptor subunit [Roseomonas genomospecies 6]KAA0678440.1 HlyD family type I secretion periplasmic adaptor subunit [Roseomonas genomospecies 6]
MTDTTTNTYKTKTMTSIGALRALVPDTRVSGLLAGGFMVLAVGFGGMTAWAALAPLHSAVMATGALAPETGRKIVKHTETAQIEAILVREGDKVKAGQVLVRLDSTEAATRLQVLSTSWLETQALEARLTAELFEQPAIEWPEELLRRRGTDRTVEKLMGNQETLFQVRRNQLDTEASLTKERAATLREEGRSLQEQRKFLAREIQLIEDDLRITQGLLSRGNATRTKLVEQQKEEAQLKGRDRELEARIAQANQAAVDAEGDLLRRRNDFREKVLVDLEKARGDVLRLAEQIRDAANRLETRAIKAPDDGTVVMHSHWAVGGTITANEPILDIIPDDRALLAEVKVQPKDIKSLTVDLPVKVQLTAYDSRVVGSLDGTVTYVSADRVMDPITRQESYIARIKLKDSDSHQVHNLTIKPGMPVEARILLSARTPLDYLVQPLSHSYVKAFIQE